MHEVISVTYSLWGVLSWFLFPRTLHSLIYGLCCIKVDDPEAGSHVESQHLGASA